MLSELLIIPAIISLVPTLIVAWRRHGREDMSEGPLSKVTGFDGLIYWVGGLLGCFLAGVVLHMHEIRPWYVPSLVPVGNTSFWRRPTDGLILVYACWIVAWLFGAPIAAAVGLRVTLSWVAIVLSAAVIGTHVWSMLPYVPDELLIIVAACAQCLVMSRHTPMRQVRTSPTCRSCGYDVSKTPGVPCPECGTGYEAATVIRAYETVLAPNAGRALLGWGLAAGVAMMSPVAGTLATSVGYVWRGVPLSSAAQLAMQYEGNAGSRLLLGWPLTLSGLLAAGLYIAYGRRSVWWLVVVGFAGCFALLLIV